MITKFKDNRIVRALRKFNSNRWTMQISLFDDHRGNNRFYS